MGNWCCILICFLCMKENTTNEVTATDMNSIVNTFIKNTKLHHVTIFVNDLLGLNGKPNSILQILTNQTPAITIDFTTVQDTSRNRLSKMPFLHNPRPSTIYVILQNQYTSEMQIMQIFRIMYDIVAISPVSARPKCLLIFNSENNWFHDSTNKILRHAWSLKILDFTILKVDSENNVTYYFYNPFTETSRTGYLTERIEIFPDKLTDMKQYPMNLSVTDNLPFLSVQKNVRQSMTIKGLHFEYFKFLSRVLIFKMEFIVEPHNNVSNVIVERMFMRLENNEIQSVPVRFLHKFLPKSRNFITGYPLWDTKLAVIVPVIPLSKMSFHYEALIYISFFPFILIIFVILLQLLGIRSKQWLPLNMFQILVGISLPCLPQSSVERIIFSTIAFISIIYSVDLFAKLDEVRFLQINKEFDTFDDVFNSKMTIYTSFKKNDEYDCAEMKKTV